MYLIDKIIAWYNPVQALTRAQARRALSYYEGTKPDRLRKRNKETGGPNTSNQTAGRPMREQGRFLDQNHDLASGILDILVANTIGPRGITVEPQPRTVDGEIHIDFAKQILRLHSDWMRRPEVTWQHDWPSAERIMARSWFRDGEVFAQHIAGTVPSLQHGTTVPYSIEMLEADFVPIGYTIDNIMQGIERNAWLRPIAFYVYKQHPNDNQGFTSLRSFDYKRVPAERMMHCKLVKRINQVRGISVFASVMTRLEDLKDYEESERIAAKVAASMAAFIIKGTPDLFDAEGDTTERELKFKPGMVFDDLRMGESVGTIDTNRPNAQLEPHRKGQLRAIASGSKVSYSSASKDYNGSYSAQRQELVESTGAYQILSSEFIGQIERPVYENFLRIAIASGTLKVPDNIDMQTLEDALYTPPQMPWIDPKKEAEAWKMLEDNRYASGPEIIRKRGGNPIDVLDQEQRWQKQLADRGLNTPAKESQPAPAQPAPEDEEQDDNEDNNNAESMVSTARRR